MRAATERSAIRPLRVTNARIARSPLQHHLGAGSSAGACFRETMTTGCSSIAERISSRSRADRSAVSKASMGGGAKRGTRIRREWATQALRPGRRPRVRSGERCRKLLIILRACRNT